METKTKMEESEYNFKMSKIEKDYELAKRELYIEFASRNEIYKVGDIIKDSVKTILIDKITAHKSFGLPVPVYNGVELKKDLTPKKSGEIGSIYGNDRTQLVKESAIVNFK